VTQTKTGKLKLDKAKIAREAKLDGKYLISTSAYSTEIGRLFRLKPATHSD